jgi:hypothetical protein
MVIPLETLAWRGFSRVQSEPAAGMATRSFRSMNEFTATVGALVVCPKSHLRRLRIYWAPWDKGRMG